MHRKPTPAARRKWPHFFIAAALVAAFAPALSAQDALMGWSLDNPSSSLVLVDINPPDSLMPSRPGSTILVFKNNSDKIITAAEISERKSKRSFTGSGIEYFASEQGLNPRATWSLQFAGTGRVLHVSAVVFADGSWEGDEERVLSIGARRLGGATETERVKGILDALPDRELSDADIQAAKGRIGDLPDDPAEALDSVSEVRLPGLDIDSVRATGKELRRAFWGGIRGIREQALRQMDRLAELSPSAPGVDQSPGDRLRFRFRSRRGFLSDMREGYRARSARNHQLLQQNQRLPAMAGEADEK